MTSSSVGAVFLLSFCCMIPTSVQAASSANDLIRDAYGLKQHGDFKSAIAILEPIADSTDEELPAEQKGIAWNILGSAYQDLHHLDQARSCYEHSINLLRPIVAAQAQFASAVDNLGSVELEFGRFDNSERLRRKARQIYTRLGDHAGVARTSSNLAVVALRQGADGEARRYIRTALQESARAAGLDDDDIAGMLSVRGRLALIDRNPKAALAFYQEAFERWTQLHGAASYQAGIGLSLRSEAHRLAGDLTDASCDLRNALSIFSSTLGSNSSLYWKTSLQLARVLRDQGLSDEAQAIEEKAANALHDNRDYQSCVACSITAQAFR